MVFPKTTYGVLDEQRLHIGNRSKRCYTGGNGKQRGSAINFQIYGLQKRPRRRSLLDGYENENSPAKPRDTCNIIGGSARSFRCAHVGMKRIMLCVDRNWK